MRAARPRPAFGLAVEACRVAADCSSSHCASGRCAAATCYDAIMNGDESGIDCGGHSCAPCVDNQY